MIRKIIVILQARKSTIQDPDFIKVIILWNPWPKLFNQEPSANIISIKIYLLIPFEKYSIVKPYHDPIFITKNIILSFTYFSRSIH